MFTVIESSTRPRSGVAHLNEDAIVVTDHLVAVIDGETNKGRAQDPTPGRRASEAIHAALQTIGPHETPAEIVQHMHHAVAAVSGGDGATSAAVALFHAPTNTVIRVGDLWVAIDDRTKPPSKLLDEFAAAARARCCQTLLEQGATIDDLRATDPCRELVLPMLRDAARHRNAAGSPFGFGAIDGTQTPGELIDVFDVGEGAAEVVLASDGYRELGRSLADTEDRHQRHVRSDPLLIAEPAGLKAVPLGRDGYDDRTYVRIGLSSRR